MEAVEFLWQETDRVWTRDFAPMFVRDAEGKIAAVKWRFNGWAKYENHLKDEAAGRAIPALAGVDAIYPTCVLEGLSLIHI